MTSEPTTATTGNDNELPETSSGSSEVFIVVHVWNGRSGAWEVATDRRIIEEGEELASEGTVSASGLLLIVELHIVATASGG